MADAAEDDVHSKRDSHFNHQRSSLRSSLHSDTSAGPQQQRSRTHTDLRRLDEFDHDLKKAEPEHVNSETFSSRVSTASPAPNVPYTRQRESAGSHVKKSDKSTGKHISRSTEDSRVGPGEEGVVAPESWLHLYEQHARPPNLPPPFRTPRTRAHSRRADKEEASGSGSRPQRSKRPSSPPGRIASRGVSGSQLDITALPSMSSKENDLAAHYARSQRTPHASKAATELYTISYLIFFSIFGTLTRLGLQALTFYPGAPVTTSVLWANVTGTLIMGFLSQDRRLFASEWGERPTEPPDLPAAAHKARHSKVKKTIPLYIGLATGFCGSCTSFSSFTRDIFLSLSNDLQSPINHPYPPGITPPAITTTVPRPTGASVMAVSATIILTLCTCLCALKLGAHLAQLLHRLTPTLPFRLTRRFLDPLFVFLGAGVWIAAIILSIFAPQPAWRGQALFACVFAPVGCLLRFYLSLYLNAIYPAFPLGTFTVNIFGTAVLGMAFDLQHVQLSSTGAVGGSVLGCQVLQGIQDGFCGCLTTVSTWIVELDSLKRKAAYVYGVVSVGAALGLLVVVLGSVRWTVGWSGVLCVV
ncbi:hypothetical protein BDW02DRAFT_571562 [Decorospora gaudefroyi]|uniref:Chromosome condensation protein-like protein n=1 Tax=Decorospora gaudefroyi TaxID=184978 RepID=A0A6A5K3U6_9PLEO|nr:hypothetical protein BDW02DRAFT_571562 [Decorospora gaudefroyi]